MLARRSKLKGSIYTFVKRIALRQNWCNVSLILYPYYDCSKLFRQKSLVNLRRKYFTQATYWALLLHLTLLVIWQWVILFLTNLCDIFLDATSTTMIPGTEPTLNLPQKSIILSRWVHLEILFCALTFLQGIIVPPKYHSQINLCKEKQLFKKWAISFLYFQLCC